MRNYINLVERVLREGEFRSDRTGTGTLAVFGGRIEFDTRYRFPLVTAKETRWKTAFLEMLWFLRGEPHTDWLHNQGCKLWDSWADETGHLGPVYGVQWRSWLTGSKQPIDQLQNLIDGIKRDPTGRRHLVTAWNPAELQDMALPPCHWAFQCYASNDGYLDMQVNQRSWDLGLGAPFNIAQYALLLHLLARATGRKNRRLAFCYGDAHIYLNHATQLKAMCEAGPVDNDRAKLVFNTANTDIDGYVPGDFEVVGYEPKAFVPLEVAV